MAKDVIPKPIDPAAMPSVHSVPGAPTTGTDPRALAAVQPGAAVAALAAPLEAVTIGGELARPVSIGGSYRVARGSVERVHVVKPPAGADPTRDPEAARPRLPDSSGT